MSLFQWYENHLRRKLLNPNYNRVGSRIYSFPFRYYALIVLPDGEKIFYICREPFNLRQRKIATTCTSEHYRPDGTLYKTT